MPRAAPQVPERSEITRLKAALRALRQHGASIPLERAQLIVACAGEAIDAMKLQHTTQTFIKEKP